MHAKYEAEQPAELTHRVHALQLVMSQLLLEPPLLAVETLALAL